MESKDDLFKSLVSSLMVCVPCFGVSLYLMETRVAWTAPMMVTGAIVCVGAANFLLCLVLERARSRLGRFTMPALLASAALALVVVIAAAVNRFAMDVGYGWLLPAAAGGIVFCGLAIFRERALGLKLQLGLSALALAVLWTLGEAGKVSLPF